MSKDKTLKGKMFLRNGRVKDALKKVKKASPNSFSLIDYDGPTILDCDLNTSVERTMANVTLVNIKPESSEIDKKTVDLCSICERAMIKQGYSETLPCCNKQYHSRCLYNVGVVNCFKCPTCNLPMVSNYLTKVTIQLVNSYGGSADTWLNLFRSYDHDEIADIIPKKPDAEYND